MGLFNRSAPMPPEQDPLAEAVAKAYTLGYSEGMKDGRVQAFEAFASGLDAGLTKLDDDHPARELLQSVRRSTKQIAAEVGAGWEGSD